MTECANLAEVRGHIDDLDQRIVELMVERAGYVAQAARFKPNRQAVVVPERIEAIIVRVRQLSSRLGGDPDLLEAIYRPMIDAYIAFEGRTWDKAHL